MNLDFDDTMFLFIYVIIGFVFLACLIVYDNQANIEHDFFTFLAALIWPLALGGCVLALFELSSTMIFDQFMKRVNYMREKRNNKKFTEVIEMNNDKRFKTLIELEKRIGSFIVYARQNNIVVSMGTKEDWNNGMLNISISNQTDSTKRADWIVSHKEFIESSDEKLYSFIDQCK